jgi:uroporphyrinogen III methyltransferase/synthase
MVVYIVGAGPGDPGLVTLRAKDLISRAEVILYDKLVNPVILEWAPLGCELIYVGKREQGAAPSQQMQMDINQLIEEFGPSKMVVRLKGGDPFIFGRGGEEAQICVRAGIPYEVVPGISSAFAAPAYAGIPVSHRDKNSSFAVLTGHESDKDGSAIDWVHLPENIIVLMGVSRIMDTARRLLEVGRPPDTPVAAVHKGTTVEQRTHLTTLQELAEEGTHLKPPVVFVIGPVASLHEELDWFGRKLELARGKRVVLTRASSHMDESIPMFEMYGIDVIPMPLIEIRSRDFDVPDVGSYDAVAFTSLEGVRRVAEKGDLSAFPGLVFAIGPRTKTALMETWDLGASMGDSFNSVGLADHIIASLPEGSRLLTLRSSAATPLLRERLSSKFEVEEVPVYDIGRLPADPKLVEGTDAVFVVSASCAKSLAELDPTVLEGKTIVSIGPETSKHIPFPHIEAAKHTIDGMLETYIDNLWTGLK